MFISSLKSRQTPQKSYASNQVRQAKAGARRAGFLPSKKGNTKKNGFGGRARDVPANGTKYKVDPSPFDLEKTNPNMIPTSTEEAKIQKRNIKKKLLHLDEQIQRLEEAKAPPSKIDLVKTERRSWLAWYGQLKTKNFVAENREQVIKDFQNWLKGRGKEEDHLRTPWYRTPIKEESVDNYLGAFIKERGKFMAALAVLEALPPRNIDEFWLFYKFRVLQDPKDIPTQTFLADWDKFFPLMDGEWPEKLHDSFKDPKVPGNIKSLSSRDYQAAVNAKSFIGPHPDMPFKQGGKLIVPGRKALPAAEAELAKERNRGKVAEIEDELGRYEIGGPTDAPKLSKWGNWTLSSGRLVGERPPLVYAPPKNVQVRDTAGVATASHAFADVPIDDVFNLEETNGGEGPPDEEITEAEEIKEEEPEIEEIPEEVQEEEKEEVQEKEKEEPKEDKEKEDLKKLRALKTEKKVKELENQLEQQKNETEKTKQLYEEVYKSAESREEKVAELEAHLANSIANAADLEAKVTNFSNQLQALQLDKNDAAGRVKEVYEQNLRLTENILQLEKGNKEITKALELQNAKTGSKLASALVINEELRNEITIFKEESTKHKALLSARVEENKRFINELKENHKIIDSLRQSLEKEKDDLQRIRYSHKQEDEKRDAQYREQLRQQEAIHKNTIAEQQKQIVHIKNEYEGVLRNWQAQSAELAHEQKRVEDLNARLRGANEQVVKAQSQAKGFAARLEGAEKELLHTQEDRARLDIHLQNAEAEKRGLHEEKKNLEEEIAGWRNESEKYEETIQNAAEFSAELQEELERLKEEARQWEVGGINWEEFISEPGEKLFQKQDKIKRLRSRLAEFQKQAYIAVKNNELALIVRQRELEAEKNQLDLIVNNLQGQKNQLFQAGQSLQLEATQKVQQLQIAQGQISEHWQKYYEQKLAEILQQQAGNYQLQIDQGQGRNELLALEYKTQNPYPEAPAPVAPQPTPLATAAPAPSGRDFGVDESYVDIVARHFQDKFGIAGQDLANFLKSEKGAEEFGLLLNNPQATREQIETAANAVASNFEELDEEDEELADLEADPHALDRYTGQTATNINTFWTEFSEYKHKSINAGKEYTTEVKNRIQGGEKLVGWLNNNGVAVPDYAPSAKDIKLLEIWAKSIGDPTKSGRVLWTIDQYKKAYNK